MKNYLLPFLKKSADINYQTALNNCTHNHVDKNSCAWYHGMWQYLRLFNLVSSPSWHHKFYIKNLCETNKEKLDVLISGLADYSMYAYVLMSAKKHRCSCNVTAIDLCKTPLLNAKWYADQMGETITLNQTSIFKLEGKFDLICADAFLTRFKKDELHKVLKKWHSLLNSGGKFITTIRLHQADANISPDAEQLAVENFVKKAVRQAKKYSNLSLTIDEIEEHSRTYAKNMKSSVLGGKTDIVNEIERQGFKIIFLEEANVVGELYPSKYLRVVAQKN